ncbi:MAG TPA: Spy/CpxP family protein refolding chaperone [Isosphaeraceae bacterium]|jgi:Spy/CpxP family protein refolding chaperone
MRTFGKLMLAFGACALMAAPAWAQGGGGFGMGGGGAMLLSNKSVQKELKVSDEQAEKLNTLATDTMAKNRERFQGFQDLSPEERQSKMREAQAELHKGLDGVLKPEQVVRFKQVEIQVAGFNAFGTPRVQEALKLTDEQKTKVREISDEARGAMPSREDFQSDREAAMKKRAEISKGATEKVTALLTEDQKKSWKDLTGEPFDYKPEAPRRPNN